jgi:hypothetical protein
MNNVKPGSTALFLRDTLLMGFGVKINSSGEIEYVVVIRHNEASGSIAIGNILLLEIEDARQQALSAIYDVISTMMFKRTVHL